MELVAAEFETDEATEDDAYSDSGEQGDGFGLVKFCTSEDIPYKHSEPEDYCGDGEFEPLGVELLVFCEFFGS